MKKLFILVAIAIMCIGSSAQNVVREGNTFTTVSSSSRSKQEPIKTKFTWVDSKGVEYPIYVSSTGSCYVVKVSKKTGKEYKQYLGEDVSKQICSELNMQYKPTKK